MLDGAAGIAVIGKNHSIFNILTTKD